MATMAFARAFSTKREKPEVVEPIYVGRAATQRGGRPVIRTQISSPMALVSTSNVHVYTAQKIAGTKPIEIRKVSQSSIDTNSSDESEASFSSAQSSGTITDASSIDESPIGSYLDSDSFTSFSKPTVIEVRRSRQSLSPIETTDPDLTPRLPQRAPSHSKAAHESLHRKRSMERMLSASPPPIGDNSIDAVSGKSANQYSDQGYLPPFAFQASETGVGSPLKLASPFQPRSTSLQYPKEVQSLPSPQETRSPVSPLESTLDSPFDNELAQLQEVAEGFGHAVRSAEEDADVMHMEKHGLATFSAAEYMFEIQSLIHTMFADEQPFFKCLGGFF